MDKHKEIQNGLIELGKKRGFLAYGEIGSGQERSAWTDVVWFDERIRGEWFEGLKPLNVDSRKRTGGKPSLDTDFVLPIIGFEIERITIASKTPAKPIKGSASNLETLGIAVGVIVLYAEEGKNTFQNLNAAKKKVLRYLIDMKPRIRIVVLTELELERIEANIDKKIPA